MLKCACVMGAWCAYVWKRGVILPGGCDTANFLLAPCDVMTVQDSSGECVMQIHF